MVKNKTKKGFTLAETLVVLAIMGIIATLIIPSVMTIIPDKEKSYAKKAYLIIEKTIEEMINDDKAYPSDEGFAYVESLVGGTNGATKFREEFKNKLNIVEEPADECFRTGEGIYWCINDCDFTGNTQAQIEVYLKKDDYEEEDPDKVINFNVNAMGRINIPQDGCSGKDLKDPKTPNQCKVKSWLRTTNVKRGVND